MTDVADLGRRESGRELADRIRTLIRFARAGGAPDAWVDETAAALVDALLELSEYRGGDHDPRRKRTLSLARRVAQAHDEGVSVALLSERFGKSRASIYRLLKTSRDKSAVE